MIPILLKGQCDGESTKVQSTLTEVGEFPEPLTVADSEFFFLNSGYPCRCDRCDDEETD